MNAKAKERQEAIEKLKEWIKPGDTIYTTVKHVSRSGMMRVIDVHLIENNEPHWISYLVSKVLEWGFDEKKEGVRVSGCGMDMGFHLVYTLSSILFRDGFDCIGEKCPSNDHVNRVQAPNGIWHHSSGGYALKQRWM